MQNKNVPAANDIATMLQIESELADDTLVLNPEQRRGKEVLMRHMKAAFDLEAVARDKLARQFDPNYTPNPKFDYGISEEERATRDEARQRTGAWKRAMDVGQ